MQADDEDRHQFLNLACFKAAKAWTPEKGEYGPYLARALTNAKIDWGRRQKAQRRKKSRTKSLDSLLSEPAIPSHVDALAAQENFDRILSVCQALEHAALRLHFEHGLDRDDTAMVLEITARAVGRLRQSGINTIRSSVPLPPDMAKHLHYGAHKFGGYHSLCPNWCKACNASNPSIPGQPLPEKCSSCGTPFPPIEERWTPVVHTQPDAAEVKPTFRRTGTKVAEVRRQKASLANWKAENDKWRS